MLAYMGSKFVLGIDAKEFSATSMALISIAIYFVIMLTVSVIFFIWSIVRKKTGNGEDVAKIKLENLSEGIGASGRGSSSRRKKGGPRFSMLTEIDRQNAGKVPDPALYQNNLTLEQFCENFRNYSAGQLKLYYSIDDIRSFIAGVGVSHVILMQGISGTGKTSLAYAFGRFLGNPTSVIPIQPMWKESGDMLGYFNEFTGHYNETNMLCAIYKAQYETCMSVICLDEINIAKIEYYFAEFLSLLELPNPKDRKIRIVSGYQEGDPVMLRNGELILPTNIWFIGTANNDDSTFAISDKVYDRSMIINLDNKAEPFEAPITPENRMSAANFENLVAKACARYAMTDRNRRRLSQLDKYLQKNMHITFGNRIMRQLEKFVAIYISCGGSEIDAIDDILSKKVLRKLEAQNPIYIKNAIGDLYEFMDELYGEDGLPRCRAYLHRLEVSI